MLKFYFRAKMFLGQGSPQAHFKDNSRRTVFLSMLKRRYQGGLRLFAILDGRSRRLCPKDGFFELSLKLLKPNNNNIINSNNNNNNNNNNNMKQQGINALCKVYGINPGFCMEEQPPTPPINQKNKLILP